MDLGEYIFMRVAVVFLVVAVVVGIRLIFRLLMVGLRALLGRGGKASSETHVQVSPPAPPVKPVQPPAPPVKPVQSPTPPVKPPAPSKPAAEPSGVHVPQDYTGTIPLDPDAFYEQFSGASPGKGRFYLLGIQGEFQGKRIEIPGSGCTFGRDAASTVHFRSQTPGVSSRHCWLREEKLPPMPGGSGTVILLTDNNSTYGTYLADGRRLPPGKAQPLQAEDRFFLGSMEGPGFALYKSV